MTAAIAKPPMAHGKLLTMLLTSSTKSVYVVIPTANATDWRYQFTRWLKEHHPMYTVSFSETSVGKFLVVLTEVETYESI